MRWPWSKAEKREAQPFTDAIISALVAQAEGTANAGATGALEACAALYAAGFSQARVKGGQGVSSYLQAPTLAFIARQLIRKGESLHLIDASGGTLLHPVGSWDVRGGHNPSTWMYRVDLSGPSGNITRFVPASSVLHIRYAVDPSRPWHGIGPIGWASATGKLAGGLEAGLAAEAGAPSAQLIPIPTDGGDGSDDDPLKMLKADIANAKGKAVLLETTAAGFGQGMGSAPQKDWHQNRIGPDWPKVLQDTRSEVAMGIARACNVPTALLDEKAPGTSQREGLRRFAHLGLEPLARIVETELRQSLSAPDLTLDFSALMASDLAGKARAVKGFVDAGLSLQEAAAVAGLMGYRDD